MKSVKDCAELCDPSSLVDDQAARRGHRGRGSRVKIESTAAGIQITPAAARNAKAVLKGLGLSGYKGKAIAIEDMDPLTALKVPR